MIGIKYNKLKKQIIVKIGDEIRNLQRKKTLHPPLSVLSLFEHHGLTGYRQ